MNKKQGVKDRLIFHMEILKIAVTGSAGSGKSQVCEGFKRMGLKVLDCDKIARQVVKSGKKGFSRVVQLFGQDVVGIDGELDRAGLRRIIINDEHARKKLEALLHPLILDEMQDQMRAAQKEGFKAVAVEVPLLFESGMDKLFNATVAVIGSQEELVKRISLRDHVAPEDAKKMIGLQMSQEEKIKRADHVIENKGSLSELFESVEYLYEKIAKEFLTI